ncbi:bifunctional DNA primase/polymerase [Acetobacter sacchari]|uniref:Bifunctional DNA primase/polymerase n=1 Tax=Acetobacter sacchari TaxID=2661687 RepID=A0ABS3M1F7_9PROT|nr:bifunctional DNA primase/polymerase [Acetobacter sacchari]MBO1361988.1 bifunctional DNA primase/polymerase [Acetobacter sacchari]
MSAALKISTFKPVALEAARLASRGLTIFPCHEDKRPTCKWGDLATRSMDDALMLWRTHPGELIGVVTGRSSNIVVLDLDLQHPTADEWYGEHCTRLQGHRMHRTRSGGLHVLFRHRDGVTNRNPRGTDGQKTVGVDMRGEGGYIIWWPATGLEVIDNIRPQPMPAWLVEMVTPPPAPKADLAKIENGLLDADRYVAGAVRAAVASVASCREGGRNHTLNAETYALARFIASGHLTTSDVAAAMAAAAMQAGLDKSEIEKTIASALRARMAG